jgi:hypothetical protein
MLNRVWIGWFAVLALVVAGCGKSDGTGQQAGTPADRDGVPSAAGGDPTAVAKADGPTAAVGEFLEALRTGNDAKATRMLSATAREKTAAINRNLTPPASDTARFTIGKVEYVGDDGARVSCTWTDLDEEGQAKSDDAIWVVRREPEGWRIAGVAAQVFPGEPPLLLNFEDPEDMFRKQQWVREEIRRRAGGGSAGGEMQAQGGENPEKSLRR